MWKSRPDAQPAEERLHHCILPHGLLHGIYEHSQELFHELFTGGLENLRRWWEEASSGDTSWMDRHPVIDLEPDPCKRIPIGIHGDDAGAQGDEVVLVATWGSTAVSLPTLVRRGGLNITDMYDTCKRDYSARRVVSNNM